MKYAFLSIVTFMFLFSSSSNAQTLRDSLAVKQAALDYIESQHNAKP
ncbi:hypothetical protein [Kordia sp.]|nr:hypothetical protein [Kordia sp.]MCH2194050.1 hypothetical protein [Kordia sp.]